MPPHCILTREMLAVVPEWVMHGTASERTPIYSCHINPAGTHLATGGAGTCAARAAALARFTDFLGESRARCRPSQTTACARATGRSGDWLCRIPTHMCVCAPCALG